MKWLSAFVIPCIIFLGITFTFFSPEYTHAQTATEQAVINTVIDQRIRLMADPADTTAATFTPSGFPPQLRGYLNTQYGAIQTAAANRTLDLNTLPVDIRDRVQRLRAAQNVSADNAGGGSTNNAEFAPGASAVTDPSPGDVSGKCTFILTSSFLDCVDVFFAWIIKSIFIQIAGVFLWATAGLLNLVIQQGILNFSTWAPDSLYPIWTIIRQIVSLFVVFAGLWLGFMYIIGNGDKFKRYVPWIIMFGLFVNFSYPLTRGLVDISNVVSLNIYASAIGSETLAAGNNPISERSTAGGIIILKLGLAGLLSSATGDNSTVGRQAGGPGSADILKQVDSVPNAILVLVFILYACYIFAIATGILIMRTIALVFLIVASPILFVDSVIPKLGDQAVKLRQLFFSQLIVAPVFMLMLALTLKFLDIFNRPVALQNGSPDTLLVFLNIIMMLGMLHITLKVTKEVAGSFGNFMTKTMGQVGGFATTATLGVATGGAGLIARGTIGRGAAAVRDSKWVTNNQNGFIGRRAYDLSNSVATSTYDARNTSLVKSGASKLGISMGMGSKFGYEASIENRRKDFATRYGRIQQTYKEDVYDKKTGELLHRKGDIDEDGIKAAAKFRGAQGGTVVGRSPLTRAYSRAEKTILNKKANNDIFEKANEQTLKEERQSIDASVSKILNNYRVNEVTGKKNTKEEKEIFAKNLKAEEEKVKKIDPMMRGEYAQAIIETIEKIRKEKDEDDATFLKQVDRAFEQAKTRKTADEQDKFVADITDDDLRQAVQDKINGKSPQVTSATSATQAGVTNNARAEQGDTNIPVADRKAEAQQPGQDSNTNTPWAGQGNTNVPAVDRKRAAQQQASSNTNIPEPELTLESQTGAESRMKTQSAGAVMATFDPTKVSFIQRALASSAEGGQDRSFIDAKNRSAENDGVYNQTLPPTNATATPSAPTPAPTTTSTNPRGTS